MAETPDSMVEVNDLQSQLNRTRVTKIVRPVSVDEVRSAVQTAKQSEWPISICGGQHAMGGQQFGANTLLIDTQGMNRVVSFDREKGLIEVESGIMWPDLIDFLHNEQRDGQSAWAIKQKQTGVDPVTIGGSLAANIHGRGLHLTPFVGDIESFRVVDATGRPITCSRRENAELFSLAIGGYGLFGVVTHVTLRLTRRTKVKRLVEVIAVKNMLARMDQCRREGFLYGDCQYSINLDSDEEFHPGVFSCYKPVPDDASSPRPQKHLSADDWAALYTLARTDKAKAFEKYSQYYLSTSGQIYWSDIHQLSNVFEGYSRAVNTKSGTEMITEVYVTRDALIPLLRDVRRDFVQHNVDMTYGTIRFIETDNETFLA